MTLPEIIKTVADYYRVDPVLICSRSRKANETNARNISIYFARIHTTLSFSKIGEMLSGRSHATILHSNKQIIGLKAVDSRFKMELIKIENELYEKCFNL